MFNFYKRLNRTNLKVKIVYMYNETGKKQNLKGKKPCKLDPIGYYQLTFLHKIIIIIIILY